MQELWQNNKEKNIIMDPELKKKIDGRQEANRELARLISTMVEGAPSLRFQQILQSLGINTTKQLDRPGSSIQVGDDRFYEESVDTLKRIMKHD